MALFVPKLDWSDVHFVSKNGKISHSTIFEYLNTLLETKKNYPSITVNMIYSLPPFPPFHPHFQPPPNIPPLPHVLPPRVTTNSASINVSLTSWYGVDQIADDRMIDLLILLMTGHGENPVASHQSNQIHYTSSHHSSATSYSGSHGLAQSHANNQMNVSGHYRSKQDHGGTHERDRDRPRSEAQNQMHSHSQHIKKEVKENDLTKEEDRKVVAKQVKRERLSTELISSVDETPAKKVKEDKQDVEEWRKYYDEELAKKKRIELNLDVDPEMRDLVALSLTLENKLVAELINVKTAAALVAVQENEVRLCNGKIVSLENQRLDLESRQSRFMTPLQLNMPDLKP
uniref:UBC core domain-containing protein n=1 Tax=Heterorhabditis bacteriophora TaxID=37862 RepID=A0A1I7WXW1_HETBA